MAVKVLSPLRGAGGGGGTLSRLNSPERLGGGGDGGLAADRGDRGSGSAGVGLVVLLGAVADFGDGLTIAAEATASGLRYKEWSFVAESVDLLFGGDCGGCTVTAGVCATAANFGLGATGGRAGTEGVAEAGSVFSVSCWVTGVMIVLLGRSRGLAGTSGAVGVGGAASFANLKSRNLSGFGAGEIGRDGGLDEVAGASV